MANLEILIGFYDRPKSWNEPFSVCCPIKISEDTPVVDNNFPKLAKNVRQKIEKFSVKTVCCHSEHSPPVKMFSARINKNLCSIRSTPHEENGKPSNSAMKVLSLLLLSSSELSFRWCCGIFCLVEFVVHAMGAIWGRCRTISSSLSEKKH